MHRVTSNFDEDVELSADLAGLQGKEREDFRAEAKQARVEFIQYGLQDADERIEEGQRLRKLYEDMQAEL